MHKGSSRYYVVAVSGGVDSVVLLDSLVRRRPIGRTQSWIGYDNASLVIAHFDHGIRSDSAEDAAFVCRLAKQYGCEYRSERGELGVGTSEDVARQHRYAFLRKVCNEFDAALITAHHMNDIAETIAINLSRGTGWRGLAVMDTRTIRRPLQNVTKKDILQYATVHSITWHEDSTNATDAYLRNRLRPKLQDDDLILQLAALRTAQVVTKRSIDDEVVRLVGVAPYSRYFLSHCGDGTAIELLRGIFIHENGESPTIPVRQRALHAIKVARQGSVTHIAAGVQIRFTRTHFVVEQTDKVLS